MSKSGDKFIQHRDEEQQREAQELAAREAYYLTNRKPGETAHKIKEDERRKDGKR